MIYAIRMNVPTKSKVLVELKSMKEMEHLYKEEEGFNEYWYYDPHRAHEWVLRGMPHETGLWVDGTKVRYAKANP